MLGRKRRKRKRLAKMLKRKLRHGLLRRKQARSQ